MKQSRKQNIYWHGIKKVAGGTYELPFMFLRCTLFFFFFDVFERISSFIIKCINVLVDLSSKNHTVCSIFVDNSKAKTMGGLNP